jgi:hypothetical protein
MYMSDGTFLRESICQNLRQSPFVTCMSRLAQSGRRTSFLRRVWFIESPTILASLFLLVYLFILDIKVLLLSG